MLPGFNHNVKYRGKVFHCQTEDSGIANPHIITHLFVGGNILATKKTSYADIVKSDRLEEVVQDLMQEQHKEVLKKLLSGGFDPAIEERGGNAQHLNGPAPLNVDAGAQNRVSMLAPQGGGARPAAAKPKPVAPPPPVAPPALPPEIAMPQSLPANAVLTPKPPPPPVVAAASSLPQEVIDARNLSIAPKMKEAPAETIFGEDLISEKSLDEVILSYLAQEADR